MSVITFQLQQAKFIDFKTW